MYYHLMHGSATVLMKSVTFKTKQPHLMLITKVGAETDLPILE